MNKEEIKNWVLNNPKLVKMVPSTTYPGLYVLKYSRTVFYNNLWNDYLINMRGLVVDKDFNIIVRPFTKIFNRFENNTDIPEDADVVAVRKINGFMGAVTRDPKYGLIFSTTGSLDSEFAEMVRKHLEHVNSLTFSAGQTYLFEICDQSDPHIIPETNGAYLLDVQLVDWEDKRPFSQSYLDETAYNMFINRPEHKVAKFGDIVKEAKECEHEGFVVHQIDDPYTSLKIKSPYYLTLKAVSRKNDILSLNKKWVDEEYFPLVDHLIEIKDEFNQMKEQYKLKYIREWLNKMVI